MGESVMSNEPTVEDQPSPQYMPRPGVDYDDSATSPLMVENCMKAEKNISKRNYVRVYPSFLKNLGREHSGWIFGAIAELVDNSRDAKARTLRISVGSLQYCDPSIPVLSFIDDGRGMTHEHISRMMDFGCEELDAGDPDRIGRFGDGFKTGAMRLGKDALVITQTAESISVAFLSQSLNKGKDNLEIPIVTFVRKGDWMGVDNSVQSETLSKYNLKVISEYSIFNEIIIGTKIGLFEKGTGTQIYIWNLDECGSKYCLDWEKGMREGTLCLEDDILIRSRRNRSRPGQIAPKVPIDFSLRSYLEVMFIDPHMNVFVQGSQVKSQPVAKSLNKTVVENGKIMGKPVQLTIGCSQLEWELGNCGMFLYWHERLIEAYKRVGGMVHNMEKSRGVIGVIDVTDLMNDSNGHSWVNRNKQGFQDCEAYTLLEEWLGQKADEYLHNSFDKIKLKRGGSLYKPDYESVKCDGWKKPRTLSSLF